MVLGHIHTPDEQIAPGVAHSELAEQPASFKVISRKRRYISILISVNFIARIQNCLLETIMLAYPAGLNVSHFV